MSERKKNLFIEFSSSSKRKWSEQIGSSRTNEAVNKNYNWQFDDGIVLEPYYDQHDLETLEKVDLFRNRYPESIPTYAARFWQNIQEIPVHQEAAANKCALEALNNGADGIIFDLTSADKISFEVLLKNIRIENCSISVVSGKNFLHHLTGYCKYIAAGAVDPLSITGHFSVSKESLSDEEHLQLFRNTINYPKLKVFNLHSNATGVVDQIANLLVQAVSIIESTSIPPKEIISKMMVTISQSTDYFGGIAKVRAARMLFFQLFRAYGYDNFNPEDLHIHCISASWQEEEYEPHANMLKSTTAAMAAIIGGCDSLVIEPEDYNNPLMVRVARNVSIILKDESYLNKTIDPVAGSYYIETLTDKLAQESWNIFQKKLTS